MFQGSSAGLTSPRCKTNLQAEDGEEETKEALQVFVNDGLNQSCDAADAGPNINIYWYKLLLLYVVSFLKGKVYKYNPTKVGMVSKM